MARTSLETDFLRLADIFTEIGKDTPASPDAEITRIFIAHRKLSRTKEMFYDCVASNPYYFINLYNRMRLGSSCKTPSDIMQKWQELFEIFYPEMKIIDKEIPNQINAWQYVTARMMYEDGIPFEEAWMEAQGYVRGKRRGRYHVFRQISVGTELEIGEPKSLSLTSATGRQKLVENAKALDATQYLGTVITPEAFRELSFPPSFKGERDTVRAIYELERMGLIEENGDHGIHVNIGTIEKPLLIIDHLLVAHFAFFISNFFGHLPIAHRLDKLTLPTHSRKPISNRLSASVNTPLIDVLKIKQGNIVEFRGVFKKWTNSLRYAKDLKTFGLIMESVHEFNHQKIDGKSENDGLAALWLELEEEVVSIIDNHITFKSIPSLREFLHLTQELFTGIELYSAADYETMYADPFENEEPDSAMLSLNKYLDNLYIELQQDPQFLTFLEKEARHSGQAEILLDSFRNVLRAQPLDPTQTRKLLFRIYNSTQSMYIDAVFPQVWAEIAWAARSKKFRQEVTNVLIRYRDLVKMEYDQRRQR